MVFERYLWLIVEVPLSYLTLTVCKFSKILVFTVKPLSTFKKSIICINNFYFTSDFYFFFYCR